jgi:hypothetical protein
MKHTLIAATAWSLLSVFLVGCKSAESTRPAPSPARSAGTAPDGENPQVAKRPWWKGYLPTSDQNDPSRQRGQYKDGFYEPEYRGISD